MNTESSAINGTPPPAAPAATKIRPFYWSVRRELWENRSITFAPMIAAGIVLFGWAITTSDFADRTRAALLLGPEKQHAMMNLHYGIAAILIMVTSIAVGMFYCLDALYGERRDRSILFWKSLPVSDLTAVLAKLAIPMAVLPLVACAVIVVTQFIMLLMSSAALLANGMDARAYWAQFPLFHESGVLLYGLATTAIWFAPIYGWLLLVSSWAQRSPLLWAVGTPLAVGAFEKLAFDTSHIWSLLKFRLNGGYAEAFVFNLPAAGAPRPQQMHIPDAIPDPMHFLTSPGMWLGIAAAAALIFAVIRLRRYRDPI
jgi:ABC-2 type transport system permease protein